MYGQPLRVRSPWAQLAFFLGVTGVAYILSLIFVFIILQSYHLRPLSLESIDWNDPFVVSLFKVLQAVSSVLMFFVPAFLYAVFTFRGRYFHFLGFRRPERLNMFVLAIMVILLAFPVVFWLGNLNQQISLPEWASSLEKDASDQMEAFLKIRHPADIWINLFVIALLPAFCEELFFRASLQRIAIHIVRSPWAGIIITAFLFSAFHMQFEGFLPRMLLGIILGALYWYSGSIWTSVIGHFVNNATQVLVVSLAPQYSTDNPSVPLYLALVSAIAVWAILHFYRKESNINYAKVFEPDSLNPHNQFLA